MRILLLNPPGKNIYVRNYYCSSTSKANYLFHPIDLIMLSGRLKAAGNKLFFLDAIAERLSPEKALERIMSVNPEVVVALTGCVSWSEDSDFFNMIKTRLPATQIIAGGDVFLDEPAEFLIKCPVLSAIYLDFISDDINCFIEGRFDHIKNMAFRQDGRIVLRRNKPGPGDLDDFPAPRQELFVGGRYRFPFVKKYPYATVLSTFGCPYRCRFCIGGNIGFAARAPENTLEELSALKELGIQEIFFEDYTFGIPHKNTGILLDLIMEKALNISWSCFSRVDVLKEDMLHRMKEAGCHTIIFGVESGNERILELYNKKFTKEQVAAAFRLCKKAGIRTVGTFILGLPEETRETCMETIGFAMELDCDFASFNVAVPRAGTELRKESLKKNLIGKDDVNLDHSGDIIAMATDHLSRAEMLELKRKAVREFYLRPGYIFKRLRGISSVLEIREQVSECWSLLKKN
ncbi:MAG: radical SAM protein [Nitrospirae bacterium]|nr:radical SAM protein [Nitrospirota bacterium]